MSSNHATDFGDESSDHAAVRLLKQILRERVLPPPNGVRRTPTRHVCT